MLTSILLTTVLLGGGPDYTKKVMVDPNYRPSRTPEQIAATLAAARRPKVVARPVTRTEVVYRTEYRRRKHDWVWPVVSVGLYTGLNYALWHNYGHGHYRHDRYDRHQGRHRGHRRHYRRR